MARRAGPVRSALRHDDHVGHLHDPGLEELEHVAGGRLHDHRHRVGHVGHLDLGLTDPDGLDHHHVERRGQRGRRAAWRVRGRRADPQRRSSG